MEEESGTSGSELNIDWDLLQPALSRDVDCSVCSSSTTSLPMSSMSPRLSPISIDSNSPYLLRKAGVDRHNVRPGAPSEPNEYNFNYRRRGLFIIINNKNFLPCTGQDVREGTDIDAERLEERFQDMGFEVKRHDDVTSTRLMKIMNEGIVKN
ncbi:hypothetical protein CHS0354_017738 [Potamilus streckersoni]|uniref:Caspase family p20 domain-containing protein n=1 Tax=Potamilus streckersoni TaxID=2493646 RepID=A0AAE0S3I5_9BIVA|nr:hypothetical protein CHS0354_017738 [Potamilus streckersoni]